MKSTSVELTPEEFFSKNEELPEGWKWETLGKITKNFDGKRIPIKSDDRKKRQGSYPYYGASGVIDSIDDFIFDGDFLLIGEDGANLLSRSTPIAFQAHGKFWVNNHAHIIQTNNGTPLKFLEFYINSLDIQQYVTGSAQPKITQVNLNSIPIPLPPLSEQQRIVARVEALLTSVNAARDRLSRVPLIMKKFRQAVLAAACSGRLTEGWREEHLKEIEFSNNSIENVELYEIPMQWKWVLLPKLGYMKRGRSKNRPRNAPHLFGGKYPFIQTGDISQSGGRITAHHQTYSEEGLAQSKLWPEKTICITIAANIAESAILTYPACFPDSVVGFIVDDTLCSSEYIEYFMRLAKRDLSQFAPATAQKNINIEILNEVAVPLPPLAEQNEIIRSVSLLFERADAFDREVVAASRRCERLTQAVLGKAFRGELNESKG